MELINIESSRVIYLTQVHRPGGQLYLPEAFEKVKQRYAFTIVPQIDEPAKDGWGFLIGKYDNAQIQEMRIYSDGIIVTSSSNMDILDRFLIDLLKWSETELGLITTGLAKPEKHYESCLIVRADTDLSKVYNPNEKLSKIFSEYLDVNVVGRPPYQLTGLVAECDPETNKNQRRPHRFSIERRVGMPFKSNVYYSWAPLTTNAHLALLQQMESLAVSS
jgi:hypothetical protein